MRLNILVVVGTLLAAVATSVLSAVVSPPGNPVKGREPATAITEIANLTRPGNPVSVGYEIEGKYTYVDPDGDMESGSVVRWLRDGTEVARGSRYTTVAADADKNLVFEVEPRSADTADPDAGPIVSATVLVGLNHVPLASQLLIAGTAQVGQTLISSFTYYDADGDAAGTPTYQWYRADNVIGTLNKTVIAGATAATYVPVGSDQGKYLVIEVLPVSATGIPSIGVPLSKVTASSVVGTAPTASNLSTIGTRTVGQTLTATYAFNDADGDAEGNTTFIWYRGCNGEPFCSVIPGATGRTYILQAADQDTYVKVTATPVAATGTPVTGTAINEDVLPKSRIAAKSGAAPTASAVSITGTTTVGSTLTANYTYGDVDGDTEEGTIFQWYRHKPGAYINAIAGATNRTYTLVSADQGDHTIHVKITPKSATGTPDTGIQVQAETARNAVTGTAPTATSLSIAGTMTVGSTLTANYSYGDVDGDVESGTTFQWRRHRPGLDDVAIPGATGRTYRLVAADQGPHKIKVQITPKSAIGTPNTGTTVSTERDMAGSAPTVTNVRVTGGDRVGNTVTASYTYADVNGDPEYGSTINWCRVNVGCNIGSGKSYVLQAADVGQKVNYVITPRSGTGSPNTGTQANAAAFPAIGTVKP